MTDTVAGGLNDGASDSWRTLMARIAVPEPPPEVLARWPDRLYEQSSSLLTLEEAEALREPAPARFALQSVAELMQAPVTRWTVRDVVPETGLMVVYGGPGSGKTFLMLDMACAIVRGKPWEGRRTREGVVVYVAAEGSLGVRVRAFLEHHKAKPAELANLLVLQSAINMLVPAGAMASQDVDDLIAAIREAAGDRPVRMVIVDTLARTMPGGNENAAEDMTAVISSAQRIERALGCVVAFVHHSGKDETKGSRGHSSLKGAADVEISVKRDGDIRTAVAEKVRDGADAAVLMTFKLTQVDLGSRRESDPDADLQERITSCVVESVSGNSVRKVPKTETLVRTLEIILSGFVRSGPVKKPDIVRHVMDTRGLQKSTAWDHVNKLIEEGFLESSPMGGYIVRSDEK